MNAFHARPSRESLSPRIRDLKRAAAEARDDADAALSGAVRAIPAAMGILPGLVSRVGGITVRGIARVVRRHPVAAALIAALLVGSVVFHRSAARRARRSYPRISAGAG